MPLVHCLIPDLRRPLVDQPAVRRALVYAIDREAILHMLTGGAEVPDCRVVSGPFPAPIGNAKAPLPAYDEAIAAAGLRSAFGRSAAPRCGPTTRPCRLVLAHPPAADREWPRGDPPAVADCRRPTWSCGSFGRARQAGPRRTWTWSTPNWRCGSRWSMPGGCWVKTASPAAAARRWAWPCGSLGKRPTGNKPAARLRQIHRLAQQEAAPINSNILDPRRCRTGAGARNGGDRCAKYLPRRDHGRRQ